MNGRKIAGTAIGAILLIGIISNFRDIVRYIKISTM